MYIHPYLTSQSFVNADYLTIHNAMLSRTLERIEQSKNIEKIRSDDELWIVEHNDVYTLGQAGKEKHILSKNDTPIIKTDRGGQVTWHGTGQLVLYWLFDLTSLNWKVRDLVSHAEQAIEDTLNAYLPPQYFAKARQDAPGVYIFHKDNCPHSEEKMVGKIASLGFKLKQGFSYHGIALNLTCDLTAFNFINPCGYEGMKMLRLADFVDIDNQTVTDDLINNIAQRHQGNIQLRP